MAAELETPVTVSLLIPITRRKVVGTSAENCDVGGQLDPGLRNGAVADRFV